MKKIILLIIGFIFTQNLELDSINSYIKYIGKHPFHEWEGISTNINCLLECNNNKCSIKVSCPLESFNSGNDNRDSNMLYYTESILYPNVTFTSNIFKLNEGINQINIDGILNFHGIEKKIDSKISIIKEGLKLLGSTKFQLSLNDYNIKRPKLLFLSISDTITLDIKLKFIYKE